MYTVDDINISDINIVDNVTKVRRYVEKSTEPLFYTLPYLIVGAPKTYRVWYFIQISQVGVCFVFRSLYYTS